MSTGKDDAFLTEPLYRDDLPNKPNDNLLPLAPGNRWIMETTFGNGSAEDVMTASGPVRTADGRSAMDINVTRNGKPWRFETYISDASGVFLCAMKDETSPVMHLDPPLPLVRYGFQEGQYYMWQGTIGLAKYRFPATAYSCLSGIESVATAAGTFQACRIDSIIIMNANGSEVRFPTVRWLAPQVGFVRRGFAEKSLPAFSVLKSFNVR